MNSGQFGIWKAVREGYVFAAREWRYLLRLALLPVGVDLMTEMIMFTLGDINQMTAYERASWTMPAMACIGWFMFQMTRLQLLGERADRLPPDIPYLAERRRNMTASVLIFLLTYMGFVTLISIWGMPGEVASAGYTAINMLACGAAIWCMRLGTAHILAAIDFPIRSYVRQVNGLAISFRLMALSLLCLMPVLLGAGVFAAMFMENAFTNASVSETGIMQITLTPAGVVFNVVFSFIFLVVLNGAGTAAMRQVLKGGNA